MIVLHGLGNVDDHDRRVHVQQIVLAQIRVNQFTLVVHLPHNLHALSVQFPRLGLVQNSVLEFRSRSSILSDKVHQQHVTSQFQRFRSVHLVLLQPICAKFPNEQISNVIISKFSSLPGQISELLLRPSFHHLPGVAATVAVSKPELPRDVLVPVLELQD